MRKITCLVLMMCSASSFCIASPAMAWELSDVSVLFPLPATIEQSSQLLAIADSGSQGPLVPLTIVEQLPQLVTGVDKLQTYTKDLRAVSLRFDPCFGEGVAPAVCRKQVRIAWQPVVKKTVKKAVILTTLDAPLHTFYEFDDDAGFAALMTEYQALIAANPAPVTSYLDVNPRLKSQGLDGAFAKGLKALILKHCGEKNLVRATVMTLGKDNQVWNFEGWEVVAGKLQPISIARVKETVQVLKTTTPVGFDLTSNLQPEGFSRQNHDIYSNSIAARKKLSDQDFLGFAQDILQIENPKASNPGTIDCAACHMAGPGGQWARLNFTAWNWPAKIAQSGFTTTRDVSNVTLKSLMPRRFRAFGYFGAEAIIAQRTINESALVADSLDQMFPEKKP